LSREPFSDTLRLSTWIRDYVLLYEFKYCINARRNEHHETQLETFEEDESHVFKYETTILTRKRQAAYFGVPKHSHSWKNLAQYVAGRLLIRLNTGIPKPLYLFALLPIYGVEAMPQSILDRTPIHNPQPLRFIVAILLFNAIGSYVIKKRTILSGILTLFNCLAWIITVGLIDHGRHDLLHA